MKKIKRFESIELSDFLEISSPFLLVDYVDVDVSGSRALGVKSVSSFDWWFLCHLPKQQAMPASLILEGMLQTLATLIYSCHSSSLNRVLITDINMKLRDTVRPNAKLYFQVDVSPANRGLVTGRGEILLDDRPIGSGKFQYAFPDEIYKPNNA